MVTIAAAGLPSAVRSRLPMSSGAPSAQAANEGEASRPFSLMASVVRSAGGKNWSSSNTPSLRIGGCCTWPTSVPEVERLALRPRGLDEVAEQDVLARRERVGGDADQAEQARHVALDLVAHHLHVAHVGRGLERADDVERHARRRARRVDGEADRVPQRLDAVGRDAPAGQSVLPRGRLLLGERVRREPGLLRVPVVDPRAEVGRREVGEREAEVGEVALGVDQQARDAGRQRLLDEHHAEPGLARSPSCRRSRRGW